MKKFKKILPILLFPLLMSNSPARISENPNYKDFTINSVTKLENGDNYYSINVTNKGDYIFTKTSELFLEVNDIVEEKNEAGEVIDTIENIESLRFTLIDDYNSIVVPNETKDIVVNLASVPYKGFDFTVEDVESSFAKVGTLTVYNKRNYQMNEYVERSYDSFKNETRLYYRFDLDHDVRVEAYSFSYRHKEEMFITSSYAQEEFYQTDDSYAKNNFEIVLTLEGNILVSEIKSINTTLYSSHVSEHQETTVDKDELEKNIIIGTTIGVLALFTLTMVGLTIGIIVKKHKENKEGE